MKSWLEVVVGLVDEKGLVMVKVGLTLMFLAVIPFGISQLYSTVLFPYKVGKDLSVDPYNNSITITVDSYNKCTIKGISSFKLANINRFEDVLGELEKPGIKINGSGCDTLIEKYKNYTMINSGSIAVILFFIVAGATMIFSGIRGERKK